LGIVLAQLVNPGTPVVVPGWNGGPYNLKSMVANYVLADEQGVAASMGRYYDLPVFGLGGSTDSKVLDQQCSIEATLSLLMPLLNGANIVHDLGFMDAGMQGSLQMQVICNDVIGWLRAATAGVVIDKETLALDVVEELGPEGDYVSHEHTFRHFKEPFYSTLADKATYSQWVERGATTMEQRAAQQVEEILANHEPEPLPQDVQQGVAEIVKREQAWIDERPS
jgi:trimethylamine--corrinoid protein Co-methyltransferase